jgi:heavy metal sensor kinase
LYRSLMTEVDRTLMARAQQVANFIQIDRVSSLFSGRVRLVPRVDPLSSPGVFLQVLDTNGNVLDKSSNLGEDFLPRDPRVITANQRLQSMLYTVDAGGSRLRVLSAPLVVGRSVVGIVQVGASLRDIDATLQRLAYLLIGGISLSLALAAFIGAFMARAALNPIDRVTQTALRITRAEDLSRRIEGVEVQDEVGRLASTFNEMLDRIEGLFRTQQRFIADISHELRTPLTTIRGNLDLLRRMGRSQDEATMVSLDAIQSEMDRMSRLVADLLLLAQADAGLTLKREPVQLDSLLLEVYRQARVIADGLHVILDHEDQAVVSGDPDRLRQLFLNLVDNAIKYTPEGGRVTLSWRREDGWVRVDVSDTGVGIPAEDLPHIFERFYRVDKARSREKGGTGLGLSIAQWIAHAHGGRIEVESQVGEGTTFTVWLPEG